MKNLLLSRWGACAEQLPVPEDFNAIFDNIDWDVDTSDIIVSMVQTAASYGTGRGVRDEILGVSCILRGAQREDLMDTNLLSVRQSFAKPKTVLAKRHGAICVATVDGAVWLTHLQPTPNLVTGMTFIELPAEVKPELQNLQYNRRGCMHGRRGPVSAGRCPAR